jgi:2-dehydropantoate 2-reductase
MTRVCIVGAGSIGGFIGTRLARAGQAQVSALARGATLAALRTQGWRVQSGDTLLQAPAVASDQPAELGVQDLVVITVKGPALPALAPTLALLIGQHTLVLPAMNGVPWWFCDGRWTAWIPAVASPACCRPHKSSAASCTSAARRRSPGWCCTRWARA